MSEFRLDIVSDRWVIVAPERAARPTDFPVEKRRARDGFCPFCEGNEDKTPPELFAFREPGTEPDMPGWRVRVVPNRFPAVRPDVPAASREEGLFRSIAGAGIHEVIIETPRHALSTNEMDAAGLAEALLACRLRMAAAAANDRRLAYAALFKNAGAAAGASLGHMHSQLIASPVVPHAVLTEIEGVRRYRAEEDMCVFCKTAEEEGRIGDRVVAESNLFLAVAPYASRFPFETWILPRRHAARFEEEDDETLGDLAQVMYTVLGRLDTVLGLPAYNTVLHTAPFAMRDPDDYHWHIEIIPRMTGVAGYEWGTGVHINPVPPESAAEALRGEKS